MKEQSEYTADKPISSKEQDRFQRYDFSKRIADTIKNRQSEENIVFGLYGSWGEGKSSVINFIDKELKQDNSIITIHLNPWRYTDEESLLYNFFDKIAKVLEKELTNKKEKAAVFLEKYGGVSKVFGIDLTEMSKAIADTNLETFKERVDGYLSESSQKLVIFIDDIDRLDKQEISILFRLIKLTADFSKTIYILSFDESMVAASIGERFGNGDIKAGENFLEKIIQVPLTIPKAQPEALKNFCFDLLNEVIEANQIDLTKEEANRFIFRFNSNILQRLETPRMAVRYSNTVSFSLPLLNKEVNTVDLMLIEALKVFYPEHYKFVKDNSDYFIGSYGNSSMYGSNNKNQKKIDSLNQHLNTIGIHLKSNQKEKVEELLSEMFPKLKSAFQNYHFGMDSYDTWKREKRICSASYFDRYFSYSVIDGDISDVDFDQFILQLDESNIDQIKLDIEQFCKNSSPNKFIEKLQTRSDELTWENSKLLSTALCQMSSAFNSEGSFLNLGMDSSLKQAVMFIYRQLEKNKDKEELLEICKGLIMNAETMEFASELMYWYNKGEQDQDKILSQQQFKIINQTIIDKAFSMLSEGENIFTKFENENRRLLGTWYLISPTKAKKYVRDFLKADKNNVITFLTAFAPILRSTIHPTPYKGDLSFEAYNNISNYISHEKVISLLNALFGKKTLRSSSVLWEDRENVENTDINLARQYFHFYEQTISNNESKLEE
jgi:predicted KAP-like P-loop ATPase